MFNKILVAVDRSSMGNKVFATALSLVKATKANLMILHVISAEEEGSPVLSLYPTVRHHYLHLNPEINKTAHEIYRKQWKIFEQEGIELLHLFADRAIAAGASTEFSQISGSPSTTICKFAESWHADLIVIGRRGHSGLQEIWLGSVSNYVVHHAPCSVLIVNTPLDKDHQFQPQKEKKLISSQ
jgi:nucleotide-binding universal stress UspA family protein